MRAASGRISLTSSSHGCRSKLVRLMRQAPESVSKAAKLADHTIISVVIAVQFLSCIFYLLSTPWAFNYGGGSAHKLLPWIAYWCAGIVTAVRLQKQGTWRRIAALIWNSLLPGYAIFHGKVNWQNPFDNFDSSATIYGMFVVAYLAATSGILVTVGGGVPQPKEKP
jgi:hypothetical protein